MGPVICDYCAQPAEPCTGADIYPHRPDLAHKRFFRCAPCGAYVGCHENTRKAFGRLANAELRAWKMRAHAAFDPLWKSGRFPSRTKAYKWLSSEMGILKSDCHIGLFDLAQCARVESLCLGPILLETTKNSK